MTQPPDGVRLMLRQDRLNHTAHQRYRFDTVPYSFAYKGALWWWDRDMWHMVMLVVNTSNAMEVTMHD